MTLLQKTIKTPCHASWNDMKIGCISRHCEQCNKAVIDFTRMDRTDIIQHLLNNSDKIVVVQASDNLNNELTKQTVEKSNRLIALEAEGGPEQIMKQRIGRLDTPSDLFTRSWGSVVGSLQLPTDQDGGIKL